MKLHNIGFKKIGKWVLGENNIIRNLDSDMKSKCVLYAFMDDDVILYIGKTSQEIGRRLYGYSNPGKGQQTNHRINHEIRKLLNKGRSIDILILKDSFDYNHKGIPINLCAGLEDSLIAKYNPTWNILGKIK